MRRSITSHALPFLIFITLCCYFSGQCQEETADRSASIEAQLRYAILNRDAQRLKPLFTENSRIFLSLSIIKDAKGFFSADQTILIFKEFLAGISILDLNLESTPGEPSSLFIKTSLTFKDRYSKISSIVLTFTFIKEKSSWKIKEIREAGS